MATSTINEPKRFSINPATLAWIGFIGLCILIGLVSAGAVFWNGL
jgi:hypothetical protein